MSSLNTSYDGRFHYAAGAIPRQNCNNRQVGEPTSLVSRSFQWFVIGRHLDESLVQVAPLLSHSFRFLFGNMVKVPALSLARVFGCQVSWSPFSSNLPRPLRSFWRLGCSPNRPFSASSLLASNTLVMPEVPDGTYLRSFRLQDQFLRFNCFN